MAEWYWDSKNWPFALGCWFRWCCWLSESLLWWTSEWGSYETVPLAAAGLRAGQPEPDHCCGVHARACLKQRDERDLVNSIFSHFLHYGTVRHPSHVATDNKHSTSAEFPQFPTERPFSAPQKCDRDTVVHFCLTQSQFLWALQRKAVAIGPFSWACSVTRAHHTHFWKRWERRARGVPVLQRCNGFELQGRWGGISQIPAHTSCLTQLRSPPLWIQGFCACGRLQSRLISTPFYTFW